MTTALTFGSWLKRRRAGLGLTQKELARRVGYAAVTLRKVEADELRPSRQMAQTLAEALELAPDEQAQFVRFARDEVHWDDIALPARATPPMPPASEQREVVRAGNGGQHDVITSSGDVERSAPAVPQAVPPSPYYSVRSRPRHNLPAQTAPLIGREHELAELAHLLADPVTRLVTILAAGGMGKTHLSIAAAMRQVERFTHGVCWVPLAPLTDTQELPLAIAAALGLQLGGERTPEQQVGDFLRAKQLLLVLDNFEHLLDGAALLSKFLAGAPQLSILVTSRQRLKLNSETVVLLDGLAFPATQDNDVLDYAAVELFLLHARRLHPHYQPDEREVAGIVKVCRLVDGMPLGILLAAAWSGVISPAQIAAELGRDIGFLLSDMQDIPARQRNLRAIFLHTWERLSAAERDVFMRLSVFRGGATLEAAQQVTGATVSVLAGLIDNALLWRLPSGRYAVHELLRQFAAEQLAAAAGDAKSDAQRQHSLYYFGLLEKQEQLLQGQQQRAAVNTIRADYENVSVAWRWAVQAGEFSLLAPAIHPFYLWSEVQGSYRDSVLLFADAAAALASGSRPQAWQGLLGQVLVRLGACEVMVGNYSHGEQYLQDGLQSVTQDWERAFALARLGFAAAERGDFACANARLDESLTISRQCEDSVGIARALYYSQIGKPAAEVYSLCTECLALARQSGRPDLLASHLNIMGWHTWCLGDYALANACWQEGLALCEQLDFSEEKASALDYLGFAAWGQGDLVTAERQIGEALALYLELGRLGPIGTCKADLALVLVSKGQVEQAIEMVRQAVVITRSINGQMVLTLSLAYLGAALTAAGERIEAHGALVEAVQRAWQHQYDHHLMLAFYYFAELLVAESRTADSAGALAHQSLAVTLLNYVRTQTDTWQIFKDKATELQAKIEGALPAAMLAAALRNGENQTLEAMVNMVLGENSNARTELPTAALADRQGNSARMTQDGEMPVEPLTSRELAVLHLVAAGQSNRDIAAELVITTGTAKWYVSQVLSKLQVHNRTGAIARGRELGLLA